MSLNLTYFKRYRMETDLRKLGLESPPLPAGYHLLPWDPALLEAHAEAKYHSFHGEIDSSVFPCLGEYSGCVRLMREITRKEGFLPEATWLALWTNPATGRDEYIGTVQGIRDRPGVGAIQNLGVTPEHRGRTLGTVLLLAALAGFRHVGLNWAFLEVTAQNEDAIRLYRRLGFWKAKTVYKASEAAYS